MVQVVKQDGGLAAAAGPDHDDDLVVGDPLHLELFELDADFLGLLAAGHCVLT